MEESLKVPKDRVAVLIGKKGAVKKDIEKQAKVKLDINSKTGHVTIIGSEKKPAEYYAATNVVKAIGRGFNPGHAMLLLNEDYFLDLLEIEDYVGRRESEQLAKKGRIIGKQGIIRKKIEEETNCFVTIYGKTIGLIGRPEDLERARKAVEMLLKGKSHDHVFAYLKKVQGGKSLEDMGL